MGEEEEDGGGGLPSLEGLGSTLAAAGKERKCERSSGNGRGLRGGG